MKKLLLSAAIAVLGLTQVSAQDNTNGGFNKGDLYVSGYVGFNSAKQGEDKRTNVDFSPTVGYFITDNIAMELSLIVGSTKYDDNEKYSRTGAGLGANYFFTPTNKFSFTLGAGVQYYTDTDEYYGDKDESNTFKASINPGINYFVSNKFALRASLAALSYSTEKADYPGAEAENRFDFNANLSNVYFGLTYKF